MRSSVAPRPTETMSNCAACRPGIRPLKSRFSIWSFDAHVVGERVEQVDVVAGGVAVVVEEHLGLVLQVHADDERTRGHQTLVLARRAPRRRRFRRPHRRTGRARTPRRPRPATRGASSCRIVMSLCYSISVCVFGMVLRVGCSRSLRGAHGRRRQAARLGALDDGGDLPALPSAQGASERAERGPDVGASRSSRKTMSIRKAAST